MNSVIKKPLKVPKIAFLVSFGGTLRGL
jgi:hypothetical protein